VSTSIIYCVTNNINHKNYIGLTTKTVERRWKQHQNSARNGSPTIFHRAIRKYGAEHFTIKILDSAAPEHIKIQEQYWISKLTPQYNMTNGGDGTFGHKHSDETRIKMKEARAKRLACTQETKQKMSIARKGKKMPPEFGMKQTLRQRGQKRLPLSLEHRKKISDSMKNHIQKEKLLGTWTRKGGRATILNPDDASLL
jgi:group I intron endonuclease